VLVLQECLFWQIGKHKIGPSQMHFSMISIDDARLIIENVFFGQVIHNIKKNGIGVIDCCWDCSDKK